VRIRDPDGIVPPGTAPALVALPKDAKNSGQAYGSGYDVGRVATIDGADGQHGGVDWIVLSRDDLLKGSDQIR
jgi:hypothetical protein